MRDKKGRFKKSLFSKRNRTFFWKWFCSLFFLLTSILYLNTVFQVKRFKEQAVEKGYAVLVNEKFTWVEIRKAIIP